MARLETRLLLGRDHPRFGDLAVAGLPTGTVCALSVGSDAASPSLASKGDAKGCPNEDAVLAADDGCRVLLAVADAHHGAEAGHRLLAGLEAAVRAHGIPADAAGLLAAVHVGLSPLAGTPPALASETTLAVLAFDRARGLGGILAFGDSSLLVEGREGEVVLGGRNAAYVTPHRPESLSLSRALLGPFEARPGDLLVAYTDGIDECHYGSPATSVRSRHRRIVFARTGPHPAAYAQALAHLALEGVDGHPGGQDNLAVAVARA